MRKRREGFSPRGFTLIELLIVIAIIAILAAIAIPQFRVHQDKAHGTVAQEDVKNAYLAAQAFFAESPSATVTMDLLNRNGYKTHKDVALTILDGRMGSLNLRATHHAGGGTYEIDATGRITKD